MTDDDDATTMPETVFSYTLAYSPDTDDAFMVEALQGGEVALEHVRLQFHRGDIQELNRAALAGTYDITAISVAAYPHIRHDYALMTVGASVGDRFGPIVVARPRNDFADREALSSAVGQGISVNSPESCRGKRIAVPGSMTSAYIAALAVLPDFIPVMVPFEDIADAVRRGEVDAGILIHELQLDPSALGLRKVVDLGAAWFATFGLPLPLGANAIRRSLGAERITELSTLYRQSIEYALAHRRTVLQRAIAKTRPDLSFAAADQYIDMYVNHRSLDFADDVCRGIEKLFLIGIEHGVMPAFDTTTVWSGTGPEAAQESARATRRPDLEARP